MKNKLPSILLLSAAVFISSNTFAHSEMECSRNFLERIERETRQLGIEKLGQHPEYCAEVSGTQEQKQRHVGLAYLLSRLPDVFLDQLSSRETVDESLIQNAGVLLRLIYSSSEYSVERYINDEAVPAARNAGISEELIQQVRDIPNVENRERDNMMILCFIEFGTFF